MRPIIFTALLTVLTLAAGCSDAEPKHRAPIPQNFVLGEHVVMVDGNGWCESGADFCMDRFHQGTTLQIHPDGTTSVVTADGQPYVLRRGEFKRIPGNPEYQWVDDPLGDYLMSQVHIDGPARVVHYRYVPEQDPDIDYPPW